MHKRSLPQLDPFLRLIEGEDGAEGGAPPESTGGAGDSGSGDDSGQGVDGAGKVTDGGGSGDGGSGDGGSGTGKDGDPGKGEPKDGGKTYDEKYVGGLREEAIKARKKADEDREALLKGFRKLLGEDVDEEETDPAKLLGTTVSERDEARGEAASLRRENAVLRATGALGVDADRLLDSRGFEKALAELDPAADTFGAKVRDLIKKAAEKDPALRVKTAPAPPGNGARMGGEHAADDGTATKGKDAVEKALAERAKRREQP